MTKYKQRTTPNIINRFACSGNNQAVVYDTFAGSPLKLTFLRNSWWVTTPGSKLEPLEEYLEGEDIGIRYLCEAGGKVGALALAKMLGHALENPEDSVEDTLRRRVRSLKRMGLTLDVDDEPLLLELEVTQNEHGSWRHGNFSARCHVAGNCLETVFDIDAFDTEQDAEEWVLGYFEFLQDLGVELIVKRKNIS